jgi:hypothetical protein
MDQWAKNTIRTLGIVLASILTILGGLLLGLLSLCAYGGVFGSANKSTGTLYLVGLVIFIGLGGMVIANLAKGIIREPAVLPPPLPGATGTTIPSSSAETRTGDEGLPHLSPASRAAIHWLIYAIAAQIGIGALSWLWALRYAIANLKITPGLWAPVASGVAADLPYIAIV